MSISIEIGLPPSLPPCCPETNVTRSDLKLFGLIKEKATPRRVGQLFLSHPRKFLCELNQNPSKEPREFMGFNIMGRAPNAFDGWPREGCSEEILRHCDVHVSKFGDEIVGWDICWEWDFFCIYIVHIHFFEEILATRCWRIGDSIPQCIAVFGHEDVQGPGPHGSMQSFVSPPSSLPHAHLFSIDTENHHAQLLNHLKIDFFP